MSDLTPPAQQPLVSIFIVSYNQREFIQEAIDSALSQDYPNIELVIGDDASSDGTREIVATYAQRHPRRVKALLHGKNLGIVGNCQQVLRHCEGKYIAFLGGDDVMLPGKISQQISLMESDPACVLCYHDLDVFATEDGRSLRRFSQRNRPREGSAATLIRYGSFNGACSTVVRRSATPPHGFDERIRHGMEWLFWIETCMRGGTVRYIDKVLGRYRRHAGNITASDSAYPELVEDLLFTVSKLIVRQPTLLPELTLRMAQILLSFGRRQIGFNKIILLGFGALLFGCGVALLVARSSTRLFGRQTSCSC